MLASRYAEAGVDMFEGSTRYFGRAEFPETGSQLNLAGWAQKLTGKSVVNAVEVRMGLENLDITEERLAELGLTDRRSGWPLEMILRAHLAGWRIHSLPADYLARSGRSKVTGTVRGTVRAVRDMSAVLRTVRQ